MSPNLSIKQHFYSKQNVQQNLRHKNVDFQCKSLQEIFVIVLILYPNLTFLAFRAYLLEPPPQDYIIKRKTIKNLNIKKCDKTATITIENRLKADSEVIYRNSFL